MNVCFLHDPRLVCAEQMILDTHSIKCSTSYLQFKVIELQRKFHTLQITELCLQ